jgi:hypothetical protein
VSNYRSLRNLHKGHQHLLVRFENLKLDYIREGDTEKGKECQRWQKVTWTFSERGDHVRNQKRPAILVVFLTLNNGAIPIAASNSSAMIRSTSVA